MDFDEFVSFCCFELSAINVSDLTDLELKIARKLESMSLLFFDKKSNSYYLEPLD